MEKSEIATLVPVSYEGAQPTVSEREIHATLSNCNSFEEFFVKVCEEKTNIIEMS